MTIKQHEHPPGDMAPVVILAWQTGQSPVVLFVGEQGH